MTQKKVVLSLVLGFSAVFAVGTYLLYQKKSHELSAEENSLVSWEELAKQSLENPGLKNRVTITPNQTRGPASEKDGRIIKHGKMAFAVDETQIVNIEKVKGARQIPRVQVKNLGTGKPAYLSGEIIIKTTDISRLPSAIDGAKLVLVKDLGQQKYIISVQPPTEVVGVYDKLKDSLGAESVEFDIVEREIQPR